MKYEELTELDHIDRKAGLIQPEIIYKFPLPEWEYIGNGMEKHFTGEVRKMKAEIIRTIPEIVWSAIE